MRVFVAGGSGAIGRPLLARLAEAGHDVVAMTRSETKTAELRAAGAEPVVGDALDARSVTEAVRAANPEVVVHQLTAIPPRLNPRRLDKDFKQTNRLRTEGTANLLSAAREAGARRFLAQSYAGWPYARDGATVKTEEEPLDPHPPKPMRETHAAIRQLESAVVAAEGLEGLVLRYGGFYGPGTSIGEGGSVVEDVRRRRLPVIGGGDGVWSFVHIDD